MNIYNIESMIYLTCYEMVWKDKTWQVHSQYKNHRTRQTEPLIIYCEARNHWSHTLNIWFVLNIKGISDRM